MGPKVGIISQARMTSTRLPGKVLKSVLGRTLLDYHISRLQSSQLPVILATTTNQSDDPLAAFAEKKNISCFRGSETDVLSRYWGAAESLQLEIIVRVTSDCPLIDGNLIATSINTYLKMQTPWLYLSNCLKRTYPRGFDFEVFSRDMLKEAVEKATSASEREHVTPYFYQNKHGKTKFFNIERSPDLHSFRLTVDEPDDFRLIEKLIADFRCDLKSEDEICSILLKHPELSQINAHIEQKKI